MGKFRRHWKAWLIGAIALALLGFVGGPWLYINVFSDPPAQELALGQGQAGGDAVPVDGSWTVSDGSQAGYRVKEILFGQDTTAVGRTSKVTGTVAIAGTKITSGTVTVDMGSVATDKSGRDEQFRNRIMSVSQFPAATFAFTAPVDFGSVPAAGQKATVKAAGQLTLRGQQKPVNVELSVVRNAATIQVQTSIPVAFADYGIPDPSIPGISTEDHGVVEVLLMLKKTP
ncbi:polyisoprenoid-binding protein YceI [Kibdelosporangium banguiense]|uniref:Polyisoprenoid-binding protein YceI n=1 Tax=Kibdelosporangium banguiense TaxID=1365924 RepID=A0ABS4TH96_9PSEU|nr:YceI family protein [Kibdelosporangium banguiense]MBP2323721.1 polyisoprenoid-binding protein YceI [Kibdelosporangium banguiense]